MTTQSQAPGWGATLDPSRTTRSGIDAPARMSTVRSASPSTVPVPSGPLRVAPLPRLDTTGVIAETESLVLPPLRTSDEVHGSRSSSVLEAPRRAWWRRFGAAPLFVGVDVAALTIAAMFTPHTFKFAGVLALAAVTAGQAMSTYRTRLTMSVLDDAPRLLVVALLAVSFTGMLGLGATEFTIAGQTRLLVLVFLALLVSRTVSYRALEQLRRRGVVAHRTIILGAGEVGVEIARAMVEHPHHGLRPVGFIDAAPRMAGDGLPAPVLGPPEMLAEQIVEKGVDHVVIAFTATREIELVEAIRTCDRLQCEITVVPRLFELVPRTTHTDELQGVPLVRLHRAPFRALSWPLKRAMDVALSAIAILLLSPVLIVIAALVRIVDGPGGILFRQERINVDDKAFELFKFRSLRPSDEHESNTTWNIKNDDRMSWLGAMLRTTSLDELPQLFNILRGDMSIVGPRPERPHLVATFESSLLRYGDRHRVPSGLTGWAQIHGLRGDTSIEERARLDNYYIENWSLWLDLKIMLRTIPNIMRGSG